MANNFTTIVLPTRPQPDTLVAIFILKLYGQEKFPGIAEAKIQVWQALPAQATEASLAGQGILLLDYGGGRFDHHQRTEKTTASQLVADYLQVSDDAALAKLLAYAERDDFYGKGTVSTDAIDRALGLSGLIAALNKSLPNNPEQVPDYILPLLWAHHAEEVRRTQELPQAIAQAQLSGQAQTLDIKQRDKKLRVMLIRSANASLAGYLRSIQGGRYDVVAQQLPSGHMNILTRPTKRVDLRSLAVLIRLSELGQKDLSQLNPWDYAKTGQLAAVPNWYFDPATNSLLNGGLNPTDIKPTLISFEQWPQLLTEGLSESVWSPFTGR